MHNYLEYIGEFFDKLPLEVIAAAMIIFGIMQGIGEVLEFKGKIAPEILTIRKVIKRRKEEKKAYREVPKLLAETKSLLEDVKSHYSADNITKRDEWMNWVNNQAGVYDKSIAELKETMNENNKITLDLLIDSKRNYLLDFTSRAIDMNCPMSKEQYQRFYVVHEEYEDILKEHGMTNGQVDVAYEVANKSFAERLKNHAFIEDTYENEAH